MLSPSTVDLTVSLDGDLVAEAKALGVDPSAVATEAIRRALREAKAAAWAAENREALAKRRDWVEEHGLPLQDLRRF